MAMNKTLIVIGGGAAGFFCAVNAARLNPELQVIILEKSNKLLSKVKVSGGGRCNVTHACFDVTEMVRRYPRGGNFLKKAFHHFFTVDIIEWFKRRGVELKTEADGRMFPMANTSQAVINCLLQEATQYNVAIQMQCDVKKIAKENDIFTLYTSTDKEFRATHLCVATGGLPKAEMYNWLKETGHTIVPPVPSLFTFNTPDHALTHLMGISIDNVLVKIAGTKLQQQGPVLITHWGLSGPCILKLSAWGARELADRNWQFNIIINWLPEYNENQLRQAFQGFRLSLAPQNIFHKNPFGMPRRLWEFLLYQCNVNTETRWADLPSRQQNLLIKSLTNYECAVKGKTTFKEEFVTAGGINISETDHTTMMSKRIPDLYFAGEVLDIDGITGGYNFQNAWTTGYIAAENIAKTII